VCELHYDVGSGMLSRQIVQSYCHSASMYPLSTIEITRLSLQSAPAARHMLISFVMNCPIHAISETGIVTGVHGAVGDEHAEMSSMNARISVFITLNITPFWRASKRYTPNHELVLKIFPLDDPSFSLTMRPRGGSSPFSLGIKGYYGSNSTMLAW